MNKLVRIINTKTLVNIIVGVFGHGTENFKEYFIHSINSNDLRVSGQNVGY